MKTVSGREWTLLAIILIYSFVPTFGGLLRVVELAGGSAIVPENLRALADPLPIVLHILSSFLFCLVGALQFLPSVRRYHVRTHRALGRVVVIAGFTSAMTGLWMTYSYVFPQDLQGALLFWVRIALSLSMVGLLVRAVAAIRLGQVRKHSAGMLRAYAIGQGASTQAVFGIGWLVLFGTEPTGLLRDVLMVSAWAANLLIAEILIGRTSVPRTLAPSLSPGWQGGP